MCDGCISKIVSYIILRKKIYLLEISRSNDNLDCASPKMDGFLMKKEASFGKVTRVLLDVSASICIMHSNIENWNKLLA